MTTRQRNRVLYKFLFIVCSFIVMQSELFAIKIYNISYNDSNNSLHSIESTTGEATLLKNFHFGDTGENSWIGNSAIIQSTMKLYTSSSDGFLYELDLNDGTLVTTNMGTPVQSIFSNASNLYAIAHDVQNKLYKIDPSNGSLSLLNSFSFDTETWIGDAAVMQTTSKLYTASSDGKLYEFDLDSGSITATHQMNIIMQKILTGSQGTLYGIAYNITQTTAALYEINTLNGNLTLINTFSIETGQHWVDSVNVDDVNSKVYMLSSPENKLYTYDLNNANLLESTLLNGSITSSHALQSSSLVSNLNTAPTIMGTPNTIVDEGTLYSFSSVTSDNDIGNVLIYSIVNKPAWAVFDVNSGQLSGAPSSTDIGVYPGIVISVNDGYGGSASLSSFSIEVIDTASIITDISLSSATIAENENTTSTIGTLSTVGGGGPYTFTLSCSGKDNSSFIIDGSSLKSVDVFDYESKSNYSICVNANDGNNSYNKTLTLAVSDVNEVASVNLSFSMDENTTKTFNSNDFTFIDEDNDVFHSIVISTLPNPGSLKLNGANLVLNQRVLESAITTVTYTPLVGENGLSYDSFGFKVSDGSLDSTEYFATVNVLPVDNTDPDPDPKNPNPIPFSVSFSPSTIGPGSTSTMTFNINNTAEIYPTRELSFTNNLPVNVVVATPALLSSDCNDVILSAPEGGSEISMSGASVAASESCNVTVNVTSSTVGIHTNPSIALNSNAGVSNSSAIDLTVVTTLPGFTRSFSPANINIGHRSTLTYTVDNSLNASSIGNLDFTDNLPSGLIVASPANASTDCVSSSNPNTSITAVSGNSSIILDASGSTFFPGYEVLGDGATCTVSVDVIGNATTSLANTTELLADFISAGKAGARLNVSADELIFYKSFIADPVVPGSSTILRYDIINKNRSTPVSSIAFSDDFASVLTGTTIDSIISNTCGGTSNGIGTGSFSYSGGNVAVDTGCAIEINLSISSAATEGAYLSSTNMISASSGTFSAASETLFVYAAPIISKVFTNDPIIAGNPVTLEYTISNPSPTDTMTDISFSDELSTILGFSLSGVLPTDPCGVGSTITFASVGNDGKAVSLSGGSLGASNSCTFSLDVDIPDGLTGSLTSTSDPVSGSINGTIRTGNQATDNLNIVSAPILSKSFSSASVAPGGVVSLEFTLSLSDSAPGDVTDISFSDNLDSMLSGTLINRVDSDTCSGTSSGVGTGLFSYSAGLLTPGSSCSISITIGIDTAALVGTYSGSSSIVNATASDETAGSYAVSSPEVTKDLLVSGLVFSKEFIDDPALAGGTVTIRYILDNTASVVGQDTTNIIFTDNVSSIMSSLVATVLPANDTCGIGSSVSGTTNIIFTGGNIAAGDSCSFDVTLSIPAGATDDNYISNSSVLSANIGATAITLPSATDSLKVQSENITLSKNFSENLLVGGTGTLEFVLGVLSTSPGTVDNITFTDDLDSVLSGMTYTDSNTDCPGLVLTPGSSVDVSGVSLSPGTNCSISVDLAVPDTASAGSYISNTSSLSGSIGALAVYGSTAEDTLNISTLTLSQSFFNIDESTQTVNLSFVIHNDDNTSGISDLSFDNDLNRTFVGLKSINADQTDVCGSGSLFSGDSLLKLRNGSLDAGASCTINVTLQFPSMTQGSYINTTSELFSSAKVVHSSTSGSFMIESFNPVITSDGGGSTANISVNENQRAVTNVTSMDSNLGDSHIFTISGGVDAARFSIDNGELTFVNIPDYEAPVDNDTNNIYEVQITVTDNSPSNLTDVQDISVSVMNLNEASTQDPGSNPEPNPEPEPEPNPEPEPGSIQLIDSDADTIETGVSINTGGAGTQEDPFQVAFDDENGSPITVVIKNIPGKEIIFVPSAEAAEYRIDNAIASYNNNGTTEHAIIIEGHEPTIAVSRLPKAEVQFTTDGGVETRISVTKNDVQTDIKITASADGSSQNSVTQNAITTTAESTIIGTSTTIQETGEVVVDTPKVLSNLGNNITTQTSLDVNGDVVVDAVRVKPDGSVEPVKIGSFTPGSEVTIQNINGAVVVEIITDLGTQSFTIRSRKE